VLQTNQWRLMVKTRSSACFKPMKESYLHSYIPQEYGTFTFFIHCQYTLSIGMCLCKQLDIRPFYLHSCILLHKLKESVFSLLLKTMDEPSNTVIQLCEY